jgi:hypothetical protein
MFIKRLDKEVHQKEMNRVDKIGLVLGGREVLYEIPDDTMLLRNPRYSELIRRSIDSMIHYINSWERMKTGLKIYDYISQFTSEFNEVKEKYRKLYDENSDYYSCIIGNLKAIREFVRRDETLYDSFIRYTLFLETLE